MGGRSSLRGSTTSQGQAIKSTNRISLVNRQRGSTSSRTSENKRRRPKIFDDDDDAQTNDSVLSQNSTILLPNGGSGISKKPTKPMKYDSPASQNESTKAGNNPSSDIIGSSLNDSVKIEHSMGDDDAMPRIPDEMDSVDEWSQPVV